MKSRLAIFIKYRNLLARINLFRFWIRRVMLGFDYANQFLQRLDKYSIQLVLRRNGASIGKDCDIETGLIFHNCSDYSNLFIGDNCHIGKNCFFDLRDRVVIGNKVVISMQCTFITHIDMSKSNLSVCFPPILSSIIIKDNVYIGCRATLLMGTVVENDSLIASCALVKENVPPNTLVAGVPSKIVKLLSGIKEIS